MSNEITIRQDLQCGDLGDIVALHGRAYESVRGFGLSFEAFVARTLAEYVLDNGMRGRIWLAHKGDRLVGCTAMVLRDNQQGQIRWVLVDHDCRGTGLGRKLVEDALQYARDNNCTSIYLETTDGLPESQTLYESLGFETKLEEDAELWDGVRPLIVMRLML